MIDKECHACKMKVVHSRHDKNLRKGHRPRYTKPAMHIDWDNVKIRNQCGVSVVRKRFK